MCVPPVASQRDGALFDRAIESIGSHNQRLERLRALFPSFQKIFLMGDGLGPHEPSEPEHDAPKLAIQSEAREPRHPNPLSQGERAHGRTASSPLVEGGRNGVTGKRAQMPAQRLKAAVATALTVERAPCRAPGSRGQGRQWARAGRGVTLAYQKKTASKPSLTLLWLFMARQTQAP